MDKVVFGGMLPIKKASKTHILVVNEAYLYCAESQGFEPRKDLHP